MITPSNAGFRDLEVHIKILGIDQMHHAHFAIRRNHSMSFFESHKRDLEEIPAGSYSAHRELSFGTKTFDFRETLSLCLARP